MPVIVEADSASIAPLLDLMPTGSHSVASIDRMHAWLDQHQDEYVVVLGPGISLATALECAEDLRIKRPTVSVVLVREQFDTDVLARSMHAGVRDVVVADNDDKALTRAVERAHQLYQALRGPGGVRQLGRVVTVFSPKGGVGKTTSSVNLALALTDRGARKVCLVDPRPRLRRRRDHHAALPDALDRAGRGVGGLRRPGDARGTAHPARGLADRAGGAGPPRRAGADHPAADLHGSSGRCATASTTSWSTPRRPSTTRRSRHSTRPTSASSSPRSTCRP